MSWFWPEYINQELSLSRRERKAIYRDAWKLWAAKPGNIILYLMLPALYLLTVPFASEAGGWLAGILGADGFFHSLSRGAAPAVLFGVCFVAGGAVLQRLRFRPCVYRAARLHGHDVCARCGYWLRGLGAGIHRCPECGTERQTLSQGNSV